MGSSSATNLTSEFQLFPSCDGCLILIINTTIKNLDRVLKLMKLDIEPESNDVTALSFYLLGETQAKNKALVLLPGASCGCCTFPANQTSLPESDLENFKNQATCFGFTRDPDFQHDPKKGSFHQ